MLRRLVIVQAWVLIRTVLAAEDVEGGQNLSVVWHKGLSNHVSGYDEVLENLQCASQRLVTPRTQRVYSNASV